MERTEGNGKKRACKKATAGCLWDGYPRVKDVGSAGQA